MPFEHLRPIALLCGFFLAACAHETPARAPALYYPPAPPTLFPQTLPAPPPPRPAIPSGSACLAELSRLGISYRAAAQLKGVQTPVEVSDPLAGMRLKKLAGVPLRGDCRLVLSLFYAVPVLQNLGVDEIQFSGSYVNRTTRKGTHSLHADGLAVDIHSVVVQGKTLSVQHDYQKGREDPCDQSAPLLNKIACSLMGSGLFSMVLTPDYDADHFNHFHLGVGE